MTITTGLESLDDLIGGGLQAGSLTLYAGTSQSGMTTLLDTTVVGTALKNHIPTLLADLESGGREARILSAHSGVKLLAVQRGQLNDLDADRLAQSVAETKDAPLHHTTTRELPLLLAEAMETHAELIAVDGARFVTVSHGCETSLTQALVALKNLAQSQNAAVVITAPINRDSVRPGDDPSLASLAPEFGLLCDTVVLVKRWGSLNGDGSSDPVELIVPKNRYGRCGGVRVVGDYIHARFLDEHPNSQKAA